MNIESLVGNLVAILAAFVGFWGVIYSQRKLARMALEDRQHSERAAQAKADQERRAELQSFTNGMVGELSAIQLSVANAITLLQAQIAICEELARQGGGRKTQPRINFRFETPVFDSHVARIGILKADLAFKVSHLFVQLKSFSAHQQDQVPDMDPVLSQRIMRKVEESLRLLANEADTLKQDLTAHTAD